MLFLRSLLFHTVFLVGTAFLLAYYYFCTFFDKDAGMKGYKAWGKLTAGALKTCANVNISVRGAENIPTNGALLACKHQSTAETAIIFAILSKPSVILKKELLYLPFASRIIRSADLIPVDRKKGAKAILHITESAKDRLKKGAQIVIFPEGTRTKLHETKIYKRGIYNLYRALNTECTPIALNTGLFWKRHAFYIHPGTMIFEFLPAIPQGITEQDLFLSELTVKIESATARLVMEGAAEQHKLRGGKN